MYGREDKWEKHWWFNLQCSLKDKHLSPWQQGERFAVSVLVTGLSPFSPLRGPVISERHYLNGWWWRWWATGRARGAKEVETHITQSLKLKRCSRDRHKDLPFATLLPKAALEAGIISPINYHKTFKRCPVLTAWIPWLIIMSVSWRRSRSKPSIAPLSKQISNF